MAADVPAATLLALPAELLQHILAWLGPSDLVNVAQTCRCLSIQSYDDSLWHPIVNSQLRFPISTPEPAPSFRDLYTAHHPHWFLTKHRVWFGDTLPSGKLILARYNEDRGCIEAYALTATRGAHSLTFWEKDPEVIIHSFEPKVSLDLNQPIVNLSLNSEDVEPSPSEGQRNASVSKYGREVMMSTFTEPGVHSSFMLCRTLPDTAIAENTLVWPPQRISAESRTRCESAGGFSSTGHRPQSFDQVSTSTFRVRKWARYSTGRKAGSGFMSFGSGNGISAALEIGMPWASLASGISMRMPEDITTYSTLPASYYVPSPRKPWQGIWVGDYSGHGCEFLVITQPDKNDERPLPSGLAWLNDWFRGRRGSDSTEASFSSALEEQMDLEGGDIQFRTRMQSAALSPRHVDDCEDAPTGRLEAIKLTGDPNIPRGEYTFIAPDIGPGGFVRIADEAPFQGARVVRSAGHIAGRNFRHDQYTPSQLIMISHDRLAQLWEGFGHISYFQRVDLDALTRYR